MTLRQQAFAQNALNGASELYDRQRCKDFIEALLQRAAEVAGRQGAYVSTDGYYGGINGAAALWSYQNALSKAWVTASGSNGAQAGSIIYGSTTPTGNYPVSWNNEFFNLSRDEAAFHTLHESLHQIAFFDDQTLANAARYVDQDRQRNYDPGAGGVGPASLDLNNYLRRHCAP